jgi:hypothetical protein
VLKFAVAIVKLYRLQTPQLYGVVQVVLELAEPAPQLTSPKPAKQSPLAALKGFLRSPPRADKPADRRSPEPPVSIDLQCSWCRGV